MHKYDFVQFYYLSHISNFQPKVKKEMYACMYVHVYMCMHVHNLTWTRVQ